MTQELIERASVEELTKGYLFDNERQEYLCLLCGNSFKRHYVYTFEESAVEAAGAIELHVAEEHGSPFETYIALDKRTTGLTENQREMLALFHQGLSDREIQERLEQVALSTIRNYRFSLREKRRQAKLFLAVLTNLIRRFEPGNTYKQNEVNRILEEAYSDYVTIRRYLVDYGFLNRKPDGSLYWVRIEQ
ncbi:MAG: DUF2087 domain-containing protein [Spirochaetaceae bacterium]